MEQCIHQRAAIPLVFRGARACMHHHPGGLIDNGEIVVFVDDVERDLFGDGAQRRTLSLAEYANVLAAAQLQRSLRGSIIHQHLLLGDELLHPRPAHMVEPSDQELVEALTGIIRRNRDHNGECFRHSQGSILQLNHGIAAPDVHSAVTRLWGM